MTTRHVTRLRIFAGAGAAFALVGAVVALVGERTAGAGLVVAGAVLTAWECVGLALARARAPRA
jgi:hypothetical protein